MQADLDWITADWSAPARVRAVSSTRHGGVSTGVYASLNLGQHVGDAHAAVTENRRKLQSALGLAQEPHWLKQVHGRQVARLDGKPIVEPADAAVTRSARSACVVMTADCLPVLFCDWAGTTVAAAHAGWRGLAAGVLEATLKEMAVAPPQVLAWLGPAIGPESYEVGEEVRQACIAKDEGAAAAFHTGKSGKWMCDLYKLARLTLAAAGVQHIHGGGFCTYKDTERFFSFRRDGECGRMATLIWLE
jgi:YfiH family protein